MFSMVCRPNSNRTECTSGTACLKVHRSNSCWLDRDQQTTEDEQEQATPDYDYSCAGPQRHSDGNLGWRRACQPTRPFEHKRHFHRVHINEDIARQFGSSQSFFFWTASKISRVCRSSASAETRAAVDGEDQMYATRFQLSEFSRFSRKYLGPWLNCFTNWRSTHFRQQEPLRPPEHHHHGTIRCGEKKWHWDTLLEESFSTCIVMWV